MALFLYEVISKDGENLSGEMNASNREEVVSTLIRKRLTPIQVELKGSGGIKLGAISSTNLFEKFTFLDKIILIRNLAATIKAGLSLNEALDILAEDSSKSLVKKFLADARLNIQNGQPLSKVFERYNKYFSPIFTGMIRAGENSGQLDKSMEELSQQLNREYKLIKKIKSALAYPLVLITASVGIVVLMLTFVLPKLSKSFAQNNIELPFLTRVLVDISHVLTYSFILDFVVVFGVVGGFIYFKKTPVGKRFFSRLVFKIPVARNLIKKIMLVRFSRTLGSLIESALSISESLNLTAKAVGNEKYETAIMLADKEIKNGLPLSDILSKNQALFPKFLISLVAVGERTGTLGRVLKNFSEFYEDDVDSALKDLTTFLEPALLLFMGLTVGIISLAILLPIYQMVGSFNY